MRVVFRVDSSVRMGSGHVMRCLSLAAQLSELSCEVMFLTREMPGHLHELIAGKGYEIYKLPASNIELTGPFDLEHEQWLTVSWTRDAADSQRALDEWGHPDWLVIDHYALDLRWEEALRPYTKHVMVIDDLEDRPHNCDLLLDQNLYNNIQTRYRGRVPESCIRMLGPRYALLRKEFAELRSKVRPRSGTVRRVLVFFGGTDPENVTEKAVQAFLNTDTTGLELDIVVGGTNPAKDIIRALCDQDSRFHYHCQVSDMAKLMARSDLAFGAAGATVWERMCLGLPSIVISMALNQDALLKDILKRRLLIYMGRFDEVRESDFTSYLRYASEEAYQEALRTMSLEGMSIVDGNGCQRVAEQMLSLN